MFDRCLFFNLNSFTRELNRLWEAEFEVLGLSAAHGYFLRAVIEHPGSHQKDLAVQMNLATSTLTRFADGLEKKGFLKRVTCPQDARAIVIQPTKKALTLRRDIDAAMKRLGEKLVEKIGQKDVTELVRILRGLEGRLALD